MKVNARSLLVTVGFLCTGCFCLPDGCGVSDESKYSSTVIVDCSKLNFATVPSDIPPNAEWFTIKFNNIRNVTYLPPLPKLYTLDMSYNSIESVSWMSLRTLPALAILELQGNQLKYVKLDIVIAHLLKLKFVNLSMNKLASFSAYALGLPQVTQVVIYNNPFHCDCDLSWLIAKMACLQACKGKGGQACCSSCSACFLVMTPEGLFNCISPRQFHGRHLSAVSTQLTDCGTTHQAETKLQRAENVTFLTNVHCSHLGLVTVPSDIPSNAERFNIAYNNIRNVTYLPPLPQLYTLDLSYNSIESVSWMSLRTLPALAVLELQGNQLKYVQLDIVIAHLPKLKFVNLSMNKLASFSAYALGLPHVIQIGINNNPFHCDCDLFWLIIEMTCLRTCSEKDGHVCCSSCSACFLSNYMDKHARFDYKSPSQLHGRHLSTVSTHLTDCGTTHQTETKLQRAENVTFFINGSETNDTHIQKLKKMPHKNKSSARVSTRPTPTSASKSTTENTTEKKPGHQRPVMIINIIIPLNICLILICFLVRYVIIRDLCSNHREDANIGCFCLPNGCEVRKSIPPSKVLVDCSSLHLVTVPSDIPSNAVRFEIAYNNIRNVTYLPPLPDLYTLDLGYNSIESVSWMSLRTLPALAVLELQGNQLKYVQLDIVIAHLPKLKSVNLSMNKLASFSQYALGWPQATQIRINNNPFHCDCDLSWLIIKMACLQARKGKDGQVCCSSCSACFLSNYMDQHARFDCKSPSQLHGRHLSTVSTQLTDCGTTHQTELQSTENGTFLINSSEPNATQAPLWSKGTYENHSLARMSTIPTSTSALTSVKSMGKKQEENIQYIILFIVEKCLTVAFISFIVRFIVRYNLCCNRRKDRNKDADHHSIRLHQIVPPIENISYIATDAGGSNPRQPIAHQITPTSPIVNSARQCTSAGGLHGGYLVTSGENQNTPSVENYENYSAEGLNYEHLYDNNDDDGKYSKQLEATTSSVSPYIAEPED
ncbi:PREDICTED: uncharacterized protein LOC109478919 [Branchiostoma belcheri]|uniref:Uncharacterized protein LOC109478919 n=1 Tax=Branchiostoma belcheri TaxID=7741 RepID=A0A6P4ZQF5_BRABE|nr:PREDICTED: uncharacterized protein LOC109478919 [Branchiostoma belcheri]